MRRKELVEIWAIWASPGNTRSRDTNFYRSTSSLQPHTCPGFFEEKQIRSLNEVLNPQEKRGTFAHRGMGRSIFLSCSWLYYKGLLDVGGVCCFFLPSLGEEGRRKMTGAALHANETREQRRKHTWRQGLNSYRI